jgi:hypothetical protein
VPEYVAVFAKWRTHQLFQRNPAHPGLNFTSPIAPGYRVPGQVDGSDLVWFRIGPHGDYHSAFDAPWIRGHRQFAYFKFSLNHAIILSSTSF